jgi:hypothetical protein
MTGLDMSRCSNDSSRGLIFPPSSAPSSSTVGRLPFNLAGSSFSSSRWPA